MNRNTFLKTAAALVLGGVGLRETFAEVSEKKRFPLTDFHIHLRGGMTAEKAIEREKRTGIKSGVLENLGREWPLSNSEILQAFITHNREVAKKAGASLPIGVQVNDRDWFSATDAKVLAQLDFVLADTMIMNDPVTDKPVRLWETARYTIDDEAAWMERYFRHNMQILGEPITILANPTYLPAKLADRYDQFWTTERMNALISRAVERNVALEIQAGSQFPSLEFVRMAKRAGATFSVGTNNFDATERSIDRWYQVIDACGLEEKDFLVLR